MFDVILIAHGRLALEMKNSAEMIFGRLDSFIPITFEIGEGIDDLKDKLNSVIESKKNYLIFSDLYCGTPYNASCAYKLESTNRNIEILSGMSLPLVLEIASIREMYMLDKSVELILKNSQQVVKKFDEGLLKEDDFDED